MLLLASVIHLKVIPALLTDVLDGDSMGGWMGIFHCIQMAVKQVIGCRTRAVCASGQRLPRLLISLISP